MNEQKEKTSLQKSISIYQSAFSSIQSLFSIDSATNTNIETYVDVIRNHLTESQALIDDQANEIHAYQEEVLLYKDELKNMNTSYTNTVQQNNKHEVEISNLNKKVRSISFNIIQ